VLTSGQVLGQAHQHQVFLGPFDDERRDLDLPGFDVGFQASWSSDEVVAGIAVPTADVTDCDGLLEPEVGDLGDNLSEFLFAASPFPEFAVALFWIFPRTSRQVRASIEHGRWRSSSPDDGGRKEPVSQVSRIMMLSRLISERKESDTREFAIGMDNTGANLCGTQPVCPETRQHIAGKSGSTGLRRGLFSIEDGPYPLRT
jgi:hypothetical protein